MLIPSSFSRSLVLPITLLFTLLAPCAFAEEAPPPVPAQPQGAPDLAPTTVAALVNGAPITVADLDRELGKRPGVTQMLHGPNSTVEMRNKLRLSALNSKIDRDLLLKESKSNQVSFTEEEYKKVYQGSIGKFGSEDKFAEFLKGMGLSLDDFRRELETDLLINKYIQSSIMGPLKIPDEDLKKNYDSNKQQYALREALKVRHILIKAEDQTSPQLLKSAEDKIKKIHEMAVKPGADFAALAKEHSQCPSAPNGGDLGFIEKGQTVAPFEDAAYALKLGEISNPVLSQFGYHIIKLDERREAKELPYEEVKGFIEQRLKQERGGEIVKTKVAELRKAAAVEIKL